MLNSKNINPLVHTVKRMEISKLKAFLFRIIAVICSLLSAAVLLKLLGYKPLEVYSTILTGSLGSSNAIRETVKLTTPLLLAALAVSLSFKMKFWNIGGEGQICVGAIACSYIAYFHNYLPNYIIIPLMIIVSMLAAGIFAMIPAYFKTKYGTNETLLTLMLNYIALYFIQFLREGPWRDPESHGFPIMPRFPKVARMPHFLGVHIGWVFALALVFVVYIYLKHTKQGYELTVVGENKKTAEYAGMPVTKIILRTLFISGAIAGLAGAFQASGADRQLTETVAGGVGFTAIIIAWMGRLSAPSMLIISILFGILSKGSGTIETMLKIPTAMSSVLQGFLLFFVLAAEFFINYQLKFRKSSTKEEKNNG